MMRVALKFNYDDYNYFKLLRLSYRNHVVMNKYKYFIITII